MKFQPKYFPYLIIAFMCVIIGLFRLNLFFEYPWYFHLGSLFGQFLVMSLLWNLIRLINKQLEKKFSVETHPATQIFLQVVITAIVLSPLFLVSYQIGKPLLPRFLEGKAFSLLYVIFFTVVLFLIFGYYSFEFYNKNKLAQEEKLKYRLAAAELEREKSVLQYHQLRNQVNPHFLFNAFSSLDSLVRSNPALASDFISHLSKVYRYVLDHNENEVVSLETESGFIQHYISLLNIRYGKALRVELSISAAAKERGVVMVTLQMLIDNAIKHNIVIEQQPLVIEIRDDGNYLNVINNKQIKKQLEPSSRQGLSQLTQLYTYLSDAPLIVEDSGGRFIVKLPLL
jgi:two-component system LytT family sensor kinase